MNTKFVLSAIALVATPLSLTAAAPEPITGLWVTAEKSAIVEVAPCGTQMCGTIVKFLTPTRVPDPRDTYNTDPAKRTRRILGLAILSGFTADGKLWRGQIYDPNSGKTYRSVANRTGNTLNVKGCISIFCQTQVWTRAK